MRGSAQCTGGPVTMHAGCSGGPTSSCPIGGEDNGIQHASEPDGGKV